MGRYLYISGVPGTGKTATVTEVLQQLRLEARAGRLPDFNFVELNGLRLPSPQHAYTCLHESLTGECLGPAAALQALQDRFVGGVGADGRVTVLLVDELDTMVTRTQDVLYSLFEWPLSRQARLAVVGIANTMDLPERLLPKIVSRLGDGRMTFKPYSMQQLLAIVGSRVGEYADVLPKAAQTFVCRKVCVCVCMCVWSGVLEATPLSQRAFSQ